jgi:hypothetical protein
VVIVFCASDTVGLSMRDALGLDYVLWFLYIFWIMMIFNGRRQYGVLSPCLYSDLVMI